MSDVIDIVRPFVRRGLFATEFHMSHSTSRLK